MAWHRRALGFRAPCPRPRELTYQGLASSSLRLGLANFRYLNIPA